MRRVKEMDDPRNGWYEIGVADATAFLDDRPQNRSLSEHRAKQISDQITDGRWVPNGESIVLTHDGKLEDGQHRNRAIQIAGKAIISYVVYSTQKASRTLDTIDTGWSRTSGHRLAAEGVENYNLKAAIIAVDRYSSAAVGGSFPSGRKADHEEVVKIYRQNHVNIDAAAALAARFRVKGLPASILGFVCWRGFDGGHVNQAESFAEALCTGANLAPSNPALILRERLKIQGPTKGIGSRKVILAMTIKCWRAFRDKKQFKQIKWESREVFPDIDAPAVNTAKAS